MAKDHLFFLSIPGLRPGDITQGQTPTLYGWANAGALAELTPTFPCVTSSVQACFWTGGGAESHGVIANGFYDRSRAAVEFWVARNDVIGGEQVWDALRAARPGLTSAVWHAQNIKDCGADFIVTPEPIHEADGTTKLWCYSKPDGLYQKLLDELGHFPLQHYWGPLANIESTRWILRAAARLHETHAPNFHWVYLPHLDYASQKYGPHSEQATEALRELDAELAAFATQIEGGEHGDNVMYVVAGEYALTDVTGVVYPNRALREAELLSVHAYDEAEEIDLAGSTSFAMVDHQLMHVFVSDPAQVDRTAEVIAALPGVARVMVGDERRALGVGHPRSGEVVAVAEDDHWFAYYWWLDDRNAPGFARTVDIHRKPGYDPVELFVDTATASIPLDATLVKGSHGAPATEAKHRTALICSEPSGFIVTGQGYRDTDVKRLTLAWLGLEKVSG